MAGVTPDSGAAGEEEYYHKHNPGGFGTAMTNFGFHEKSMQDGAYNAINPTKPESQWGVGDRMKHWGANLAAGAGWVGDLLASPFRHGTRSFLRAGSHLSEGNYGKGLMHGTLGTASAALGVLPGIGAVGRGVRVGAGLLSGVPQIFEGAKQAPAPPTPKAPAEAAAEAPADPSNFGTPEEYPDIAAATKNFGANGATNYLNYAGHLLPPSMVAQNPFYENATNYKNKTLGGAMNMATRFLAKGPAPESSMRAFAESEGSQGNIAAQDANQSAVMMALQNALYGGGGLGI